MNEDYFHIRTSRHGRLARLKCFADYSREIDRSIRTLERRKELFRSAIIGVLLAMLIALSNGNQSFEAGLPPVRLVLEFAFLLTVGSLLWMLATRLNRHDAEAKKLELVLSELTTYLQEVSATLRSRNTEMSDYLDARLSALHHRIKVFDLATTRGFQALRRQALKWQALLARACRRS